jgi:hypothetical protein
MGNVTQARRESIHQIRARTFCCRNTSRLEVYFLIMASFDYSPGAFERQIKVKYYVFLQPDFQLNPRESAS